MQLITLKTAKEDQTPKPNIRKKKIDNCRDDVYFLIQAFLYDFSSFEKQFKNLKIKKNQGQIGDYIVQQMKAISYSFEESVDLMIAFTGYFENKDLRNKIKVLIKGISRYFKKYYSNPSAKDNDYILQGISKVHPFFIFDFLKSFGQNFNNRYQKRIQEQFQKMILSKKNDKINGVINYLLLNPTSMIIKVQQVLWIIRDWINDLTMSDIKQLLQRYQNQYQFILNDLKNETGLKMKQIQQYINKRIRRVNNKQQKFQRSRKSSLKTEQNQQKQVPQKQKTVQKQTNKNSQNIQNQPNKNKQESKNPFVSKRQKKKQNNKNMPRQVSLRLGIKHLLNKTNVMILEQRIMHNPQFICILILLLSKKGQKQKASVLTYKHNLQNDFSLSKIIKFLCPISDIKFQQDPLIILDAFSAFDLENQLSLTSYVQLKDFEIFEQDVVMVDSINHIFQMASNELQKSQVIAMDIETSGGLDKLDPQIFETIQISTISKVFIFDIPKLSKNPVFLQLLYYLFTNTSNQKVIGFSFLQNDAKSLRKMLSNCYKSIKFKQVIDLQQTNPIKKGISLKKLAQQIYQKSFSKFNQCSGWNRRPLRKSQLHYAALDAYILIQLNKKFNIIKEDYQVILKDI